MPLTAGQYLEQVLDDLERTILAGTSPEERAVLAHDAVTAWEAGKSRLARLRRGQFRQLASRKGLSTTDIAGIVGITRQRVQQILAATPRRKPK